MILGIDHIQLAMPQGGEDTAHHFYEELLGMQTVPKPPQLASRGGCWFKGGDAYVHLGIQDGFLPARKAHPAFLVANLEHLRAGLEEAGIKTVLDHTVPGVRRFYAADPFGNRIEFIQHGDGFSQRRED